MKDVNIMIIGGVMRENKYKVWAVTDKRWCREDEVTLYPDGILYKRIQGCFRFVNQEMYKIVFYTGIKDKNGKEIYESDIVTWTDTEGSVYIKAVAYNVETLSFQIGNISYSNLSVSGYFQTKLEVIGNIYEHKNLLEDK